MSFEFKFQTCLNLVHVTLDVAPETIVGPNRGGPKVTRARAIAAYLASTECGMSDSIIAKFMRRDRASVTHMLKLIESLRDHEQIDAWLNRLTCSALNPAPPDQDTLNILLTALPEQTLALDRPQPIIHDAPMKYGAHKVLEPIAKQYDTTPRQIVSRAVPPTIRHEAWRALYQFTSPQGRRIFSQDRIAEIAGVTQAAVSRALGSLVTR